MKMIKLFILALALSVPLMSHAALTDDEQVQFADALQGGDFKVVKKFLDSGAAGVNDKYFGWEALGIAAGHGNLPAVKYLVEKGADLNYQHPISKNTALQLAALSNYPEIVKYLISKGADPDLKLRAGVSLIRPLRDEGNTKMIEILKAAGTKEEGCEGECF
jgi:ankyrin repeat protein